MDDDRPAKVDATVTKNYLREAEVRTLDRLTTQFLDYAESWQVEATDIMELLALEKGDRESIALGPRSGDIQKEASDGNPV